MKDVLVKHFTPEGIQSVVTIMAEKKLVSGPGYLQTWKNFVSRIETPKELTVKYLGLGVQTLKRARGQTRLRQAPELNLSNIASAFAARPMRL